MVSSRVYVRVLKFETCFFFCCLSLSAGRAHLKHHFTPVEVECKKEENAITNICNLLLW